MPEEQLKNGKAKWIALVTSVLSFVIGIVVAAYVLGQRTGKVGELVQWKNETAPRIERMDSKGTVSFELFHIQYDKEQAQQYERIKDLEKAIYEKRIEDLKLRIETLERKPHENSN